MAKTWGETVLGNILGKTKKFKPANYCPYCGKEAKLVTGKETYPHRPDLFSLKFWQCKPCDAFVGCHKPHRLNNFADDVALGKLANFHLRKARSEAHRAFDPIWRSGELDRGTAYLWLANALQLPTHLCHIGEFNMENCQKTVQLCVLRDLPDMGD